MSLNILVVEDDCHVQEQILNEVRRVSDQAEVLFVHNGHDAVTLFDRYREHLQLVLINPNVPWVHGPTRCVCSFFSHIMRPCNQFKGELVVLAQDHELPYRKIPHKDFPVFIRSFVQEKSPV